MTWFLNAAQAMPTDAEPVEGQIPSWGQQFTGSGRDLWWRRDSWNASRGYQIDLENEMIDALGGMEAVYPTKPDEIREFWNQKTRGHFLARRIGELRGIGTDGQFADLPASAEEFDAQVLGRRKSDFDRNRAMLDRGDSESARVLGEMAATMAEPTSLATLPLGGPLANAGRFIATEAALGVVSDIPGVLREQQVAGDLDFTPSNPMTELAVSGVAAAGFAGLVVGAGRSIDYLRGRRQAETEAQPEGRPGMDWEDDLEGAESQLRAGRDPAPAGPYRPDPQLRAEDDPSVQNILRLISKIEAPKGYDQVFGGVVVGPPRPITTMTVNQVLAWQAATVRAGSKSSAAGAFQIIQDTLRSLRDDMKLSGNELFDGAMQNRMAVQLMKRRGLDEWRAGRMSTAAFMDNMAQEWAALPRATGPNAGRSHYAGDGLNASRVGLDEAMAYFEGEQVPDVIRGGGSVGPRSAAAWTQMQSQPLPRFDQVTTPGGTSVNVGYRVADLSELRAASGDLQPRDRSRSASDEQIAGIARNLDPRRLLPSPEAQSGAPIIGPDGMVESGNGRVAALNRAATEHPDRYQAYVRALEDAGYQIPEGVERPVLVAERLTELDFEGRRKFVRESNTSSTGRMSATEQAGLDTGYLSQHAFDGYKPGRALNAAENTEFVRRVFAAMPQSERAALMTADGRLNIDGLRRLRQALFARAFGADDLLKMLAETDHPAVENMLRMLEDLAPDWAAFRSMVEAGQVRPDFDITDQLMDAVRTIAKARTESREGQTVIAALRDKLAQGDMFADRDRDLAEAMISVFYRGDRSRPAEATATILQRYIADAEAFGRADIDDLLGDTDALTPLSVLRGAVEAQDARAPLPDRIAQDATDEAQTATADLRALDAANTHDGAPSPALTRATDAARRELGEQPAVGTFGPVFSDIVDDPDAAIARLMQEKAGEVPVAFRHPDPRLGDISLIYGNEKFGLRHIEVKHPEMIAEIPRLLRDGRVVEDAQGLKRVYLTDDADPPAVAVLRLDWDGAEKTWVVTAFTDENRGFKGIADGQAEVISDRPTHTVDPFLGQEVGAAPNSRQRLISDEPDGTGPSQDIPASADFQGDEVQRAIADARAALAESPDLTIRLGEGDNAQSFALADVLDSMTQDESLIARMTSCSLKGAPR